MPELLKNIYNKEFFKKFIEGFKNVKPDFDDRSFLQEVYSGDWEDKELKQRMRHITITLNEHLSDSFDENIKLILKSIPFMIDQGFKPDNLEFIFYPDFVEVFGRSNYESSIKAIEKITQYVTCEFAVRPFIIDHEKETINYMTKWSKHKHPGVRRLASEGCRPRLPWAIAIPAFKNDPEAIIPILEKLKNDPSETVRRSVANNLNDISKDNPDVVIALAIKWKGKSVETDKLVKHACRSLLKEGNLEVMQLFDFGAVDQLKITNFKIANNKVRVGGYLDFQFELYNSSSSKLKLRLEYGIYYQKANGSLSRKVFKISERYLEGRSKMTINKKQSFKIITTRKFHKGKHQIAIIINGKELDKLDFQLDL